VLVFLEDVLWVGTILEQVMERANGMGLQHMSRMLFRLNK
jgi:hypothetical protein